MTQRSNDLIDGAPVYLRRFLRSFLVRCPRCKARATVVWSAAAGLPRATCVACAHVEEGWAPPTDAYIERCRRARCSRCNEWLGAANTLYRASSDELDIVCPCGAVRTNRLPSRSLIGAPVDPYLRIPLWLQTPVGGENLWAYNVEHLEFLGSYLSGTLRTRAPNENRSLASRLPAWMKSAKRRDDVLNGIARLRQRADKT